MQQAASDARGFAEGLTKENFLADKRTQRAVIMSILSIGEATTKIMDGHHGSARAHGEGRWNGIRGMRNRMAHGYFDIDVVWDTVQTALPELPGQLPRLRRDIDGDGR
jgi:uncharacterized protein with HEPN domain